MATTPARRTVLDPVERVSEILFGLIMVLAFTSSLSATTRRAEVHETLLAALSCNLAWSIVDAVMYIMTSVMSRSRGVRTLQAVRKAGPEQGREILADALDPDVAAMITAPSLEALRQDLAGSQELPDVGALTSGDIRGAIEVFLLVFLSTFPVAVPFLVFTEAKTALRVSNAVAVVLMCAMGYSLGRYSGLRPWRVALGMGGLGVGLVAVTIALGG